MQRTSSATRHVHVSFEQGCRVLRGIFQVDGNGPIRIALKIRRPDRRNWCERPSAYRNASTLSNREAHLMESYTSALITGLVPWTSPMSDRSFCITKAA